MVIIRSEGWRMYIRYSISLWSDLHSTCSGVAIPIHCLVWTQHRLNSSKLPNLIEESPHCVSHVLCNINRPRSGLQKKRSLSK